MGGLVDFNKAVEIDDSLKAFAQQLEDDYHVKVLICKKSNAAEKYISLHDFVEVRILLSSQQDHYMSVNKLGESLTELIGHFPSTSDGVTEYDLGWVSHTYNELYFNTAQGAVVSLLCSWNLPKIKASGEEYATREERRERLESIEKLRETYYKDLDISINSFVEDISARLGVKVTFIDRVQKEGAVKIIMSAEITNEQLNYYGEKVKHK